MERSLRIILSKEKKTEFAFLVARILAPPLPAGLVSDEIITGYAIIAANDVDRNGVYSYVHLEKDEKEAIGNMLEWDCASVNEWMWCEMFENEIKP